MKLRVRVMLENDRGEPFMGIGLLQLLRAIAQEKSVSRAARAMGLSYVKALRILERLEKNLGRRIVTRVKGGADHGGAYLTAEGQQLIRDYSVLQESIARAAAKAFRKFRAKQTKSNAT